MAIASPIVKPEPPTQRQLQVLILAARGLTYKQIASALGISEETIKTHVSAMLRRLNAQSMTHALLIAIQNKFVVARNE